MISLLFYVLTLFDQINKTRMLMLIFILIIDLYFNIIRSNTKRTKMLTLIFNLNIDLYCYVLILLD